jgi:hypothetical protein
MAGRVPLKIVYLLMRWLPGLVVLMSRGDRAKDAELLVLRHESAVLRRNAGRVRYEPADRAWFAARRSWVRPGTGAAQRLDREWACGRRPSPTPAATSEGSPSRRLHRTWPLPAVLSDLTAAGFAVTTMPLQAPGRSEDSSPRYRLVLARRAGPP